MLCNPSLTLPSTKSDDFSEKFQTALGQLEFEVQAWALGISACLVKKREEYTYFDDRVRRHVWGLGAHAGCGCHSNQQGTAARFAKTTNGWNLGIMIHTGAKL